MLHNIHTNRHTLTPAHIDTMSFTTLNKVINFGKKFTTNEKLINIKIEF